MSKHSTQRFSDRVENYVKYRPTYPIEVVETLQRHTGLTPLSSIADIGSGTGISTRLLLSNGNRVYAVEPNDEMRLAAESNLSQYSGFCSIAATAEETTLASQSIDYIIAAQAFHWFDVSLAQREFRRILRSGGWVVLMWNTRRINTTPFLQAYERIVQSYGTDYQKIRHRNIEPQSLMDFLGVSMQHYRFSNHQLFDFESLKGRLLSSSYIPSENHPAFPRMIAELQQIFAEYSVNGQVSFDYDTELYLAQWQ